MPFEWNNILVVSKEELVPEFYTSNTLYVNIQRYKNKSYGIKRVCTGGNGRQLLIAFDSLPRDIQMAIGDPRKCDHILERFYTLDADAVGFYANYQFEDGTYLDMEYQERYIINASMIKALFALKEARETERLTKGGNINNVMISVHADALSFQATLKKRYRVEHTLPANYRRFKDALNKFQKDGYESLISKMHRNHNPQKVTDETLALLNSMFAGQKHKPTPTEVHRQYDAFLTGYMQVINNETGEDYNPKDFKKLSERTVTRYMAQWANAIGTYKKRSGDNQKYMGRFKTYHSLDRPVYAGSILSIDDRQPPFKMPDGNRLWFYNGLDVASNAITVWVYGKSKEGIILEFYRQLVRNYVELGICLPAELEAESNLNSSFKETFLREGAMFQYVRIEANNARGKVIESLANRELRYKHEKEQSGWRARPHARLESNQPGPGQDGQVLPYDRIVEVALRAIEDFNNEPHPEQPELSRWEYFMERQNPNLQPINWKAFMYYLGHQTHTSCNVGIIRLQGNEYLLGDNDSIALGDELIGLMQQVEGEDVNVYWLDGNDGQVMKALVYKGTKYICEAIAKPTYNRARIEQTPADAANRELMSSYVATIEAYGRRATKALDPITIIDNTPKKKKAFVMPGLRQDTYETTGRPEIMPEPEDSDLVPVPERPKKSMFDRF